MLMAHGFWSQVLIPFLLVTSLVSLEFTGFTVNPPQFWRRGLEQQSNRRGLAIAPLETARSAKGVGLGSRGCKKQRKNSQERSAMVHTLPV
jgi:hypothetical protein